VEFFVPDATVGNDPLAFLNTVSFTYGGYPLSAWGNGNNLRGATAILNMANRALVIFEYNFLLQTGTDLMMDSIAGLVF